MPMFASPSEHEMFLRMYGRTARKFRWQTLAWALMKNHHHFVIRLADGGLSEGMRELNGGYSRWRNALYGRTGEGHLVRHAFFARTIEDDADLIGACAYVDSNPLANRQSCTPRRGDWSGYAATLGLMHPRPFHTPSAVLELLSERPAAARTAYRRAVQESHARRRLDLSPNHVIEVRPGGMVRSFR